MNTALLKTACATGLLAAALLAGSPTAGAMPGASGVGPILTVDCRPTATAFPTPCNAGLPAEPTAVVRCPCNGGLPVEPTAVAATRAVPAPAAQPSTTLAPGGAFDWADAGIGAGAAVMFGLLAAGGALTFGRRRVRGPLRSS